MKTAAYSHNISQRTSTIPLLHINYCDVIGKLKLLSLVSQNVHGIHLLFVYTLFL